MAVKRETLNLERGRPFTQGTVLAKIMKDRRIRVAKVAGALGVSERHVYNYFIRDYSLTILQVAALVELLGVEPEDLVNNRGYLLKLKQGDS